MHLAGQIILVIFILWTVFTLIILSFIRDMYDFLRSPGFIVLCVGYIALSAIYSIYKHVVRDYDKWERER